MPQTNAEQARELAKNSSDCSFLLTHLIRQNGGKSDGESRNALSSILDISSTPPQPKINASIVGWYGTSTPNIYNPRTDGFVTSRNNRAVCFTESTLAGLRAHRDLFNAKYGLAFDRDDLFDKGANPCLNLSDPLLRTGIRKAGEHHSRFLYNFIPSELLPFINVINSSFDATHEREWRHVNDMLFMWSDLRFVFCPENEFYLFNAIQNNSMPCLFDLAWLDRV